MESATAAIPLSMDDQYLQFVQETQSVFYEFPELECLRYFIFRDLVVEQRKRKLQETAKHWIRPLRWGGQKIRTPHRAEVIVLIEGQREVIREALLPVHRELVARGVRVALLGTGGIKGLPEPASYLTFRPYVFPPRWAQAAWVALSEQVKQLRHRSLERLYKNCCGNMRGLWEGLDRILTDIYPKVVVVGSTQLPAGAGAVVAARKRGIITLLLQHGVLQPQYLPLIADKMVTWGRSSTDTFLRLGVASDKLVPCGSPRHDGLRPSVGSNAKDSFLHTLDLPNRPTLVFFSNGNDLRRNGEAPRECARWLETTAREFRNMFNIVVRLHPNEDGSLYAHCLNLHVTKNSPDLSLTLEGCDIVASLCSTVLYDALLFKKPVWQFHAEGWPELADNWRQGLATRIATQVELRENIESILESGWGPIDPCLPGRVFANQGRAAQAISDYIEQRLASG